ncbi:hypothetical protein QTP86_010970 [Hemibagrus guttatus]|nr:hypothetical protein QTP86_010970 [Hemibagrus guttatus]
MFAILLHIFFEGTVVNRRQGHGRPRLIDACEERRLARVIRSNRRATVAQIAEELNVGPDRKVSEYTVYDSSSSSQRCSVGLSPSQGSVQDARVLPLSPTFTSTPGLHGAQGLCAQRHRHTGTDFLSEILRKTSKG